MKTLRFQIRADEVMPDHRSIMECAAILKRGGMVAMPTETVYGLATNALDAVAVTRVFEAKERPSWDPLIVHVSSFEMIARIAAGFPDSARELAERFWPGPLTLLLPRSPQLPSVVTAGRDTVAVRMPVHPVARALITAAGLPLAAPSANRFGGVSPTTAEHVLRDLDGRIDAVLDAGATSIGIESSVVDALHNPPLLLRSGGVTREQLESVVGPVEIYSPSSQNVREALPSPGLAARHYAPNAKLRLVEGSSQALLVAIEQHVPGEAARGEYVGVMVPDQWLDSRAVATGGIVLFDWGIWGNWAQLAQNLFAGLRYLDKPGVSVILCPLPPEEGIGTAIRDRLLRATQ